MRQASSHAFTLTELLVVCAVLAVLALTLAPGLARSTNSKTLQCMNNHRQLAAAWRLNADDNNDRIVYASTDGSNMPNAANSNAWTWSQVDGDGNNRANWDTNADMVLRPLWPYTGKDASLFKCPSDRSYVTIAGGQAKPRVRSVSMNLFLGGFAGTTGGWPFMSSYQMYLKVPEVTVPARIFIFLDMRSDRINWGNFMTMMDGYPNNPSLYQLSDLPGFYHEMGCTFCFVDGHVELRRWLDLRTTPPVGPIDPSGGSFSTPFNPDVAWLQDHATRPK